MTHDEMVTKLYKLISAAQHWQMSADNYSSEDCANYILYQDLTKERELELLAEHDRLTAELDRLRWHYPERGEVPEKWSEIVYETRSLTATAGEYRTESGSPDGKFVFYSNYSYSGIDDDKVYRWRYIE